MSFLKPNGSSHCSLGKRVSGAENNGVFLKWIRNSVNSWNAGNLKNHWRVNWAQFKDSFCYLCLVGIMVASWSLTHEVAGSNNLFNIKYFLSLNLVKTFRGNSSNIGTMFCQHHSMFNIKCLKWQQIPEGLVLQTRKDQLKGHSLSYTSYRKFTKAHCHFISSPNCTPRSCSSNQHRLQFE